MKRAMVNAVFRLRNEIPKRANPDLQQGRARATFPDLLQERARVNPDLQQERARATFDVQTLRDKLHRFSAGSFAWKRRKEIGGCSHKTETCAFTHLKTDLLRIRR